MWFKSVTIIALDSSPVHASILFGSPFSVDHCQFLQPVGDIDLDSFEAVCILCCNSLDNLLVSVSSIGDFYTLQITSKIILPIIHNISMTAVHLHS